MSTTKTKTRKKILRRFIGLAAAVILLAGGASAVGAVTGNYWDYPTQSDTAPTAEAPPGGANSANFASAVGGPTTDVGAYTGTTSAYGGFDFGGNLFEMNEGIGRPTFRVLRGGSWGGHSGNLAATFRSDVNTTIGNGAYGFRVASIPEPSTFTLAGLGLIGLLAYGCRRRSAGRESQRRPAEPLV